MFEDLDGLDGGVHTQASRRSAKFGRILDNIKKNPKPNSPSGQIFFLITCVVAILLDPLFFYIPLINDEKKCFRLDRNLGIITSVFRSVLDLSYVVYIICRLRNDFFLPLMKPKGTYEGNRKCWEIAQEYLVTYFPVDFLAILPLPQIATWIMIPTKNGLAFSYALTVLKTFVFLQSVPRAIRIYPLNSNIFEDAPIVRALFNLLLYVLISHVFGAYWYFLSVERMTICWKRACANQTQCNPNSSSFYCNDSREDRTFLNDLCPVTTRNATIFNFGIFLDALQSRIVETTDFPQKLAYCLQWSLQNLSGFGQNLKPSTYVWENLFVISITLSGLVLFIVLIGNVQTYLQSKTIKFEEMRLEAQENLKPLYSELSDMLKEWRLFSELPENLKLKVMARLWDVMRKTKVVDLETLLNDLPRDLRMDIKHQLCINMVKKVKELSGLDEQVLDELCGLVKPIVYNGGKPINEMLFIVRGKATIYPSKGKTRTLQEGDFFGQELVAWAKYHHSTKRPKSTCKIQANRKVQAFALMADDLKNVFETHLLLVSPGASMRLMDTVAKVIQLNWRRRGQKDVARSLQKWRPFMELSENLKEQVMKHLRLIGRKDKGVDLQCFLNYLPKKLLMDIKRELCLKLLKKVKELEGLDEEELIVLCNRVKPVIYDDQTIIVSVGDAVEKMFFIVLGKVRMYTYKSKTKTTSTDKSEHNESIKEYLGEGDFCGEELVAWTQNFPDSTDFPISTSSIQATGKVEAFALMTGDLKDVYKKYQIPVSPRVEQFKKKKCVARLIQSNWRKIKQYQKGPA